MLVPPVPDHDVAVRYRGSAPSQLLDVSFVAARDIDPRVVRVWALQIIGKPCPNPLKTV